MGVTVGKFTIQDAFRPFNARRAPVFMPVQKIVKHVTMLDSVLRVAVALSRPGGAQPSALLRDTP